MINLDEFIEEATRVAGYARQIQQLTESLKTTVEALVTLYNENKPYINDLERMATKFVNDIINFVSYLWNQLTSFLQKLWGNSTDEKEKKQDKLEVEQYIFEQSCKDLMAQYEKEYNFTCSCCCSCWASLFGGEELSIRIEIMAKVQSKGLDTFQTQKNSILHLKSS